MSATAPRPRVATGPHTEAALVVALTSRLRQAVEMLPPAEAAALLGELRELVQTGAPRPRHRVVDGSGALNAAHSTWGG
jgi:hypothetical protein